MKCANKACGLRDRETDNVIPIYSLTLFEGVLEQNTKDSAIRKTGAPNGHGCYAQNTRFYICLRNIVKGIR